MGCYVVISNVGNYLLLEATSTRGKRIFPGNFARLISPRFPRNAQEKLKCLLFSMSVYGPHVGTVRIREELGREQFYYEANERNVNLTQWLTVSVQLVADSKLFVLEVSRGGLNNEDDKGDICIDDLSVIFGRCRKSILAHLSTQSAHGATLVVKLALALFYISISVD